MFGPFVLTICLLSAVLSRTSARRRAAYRHPDWHSEPGGPHAHRDDPASIVSAHVARDWPRGP